MGYSNTTPQLLKEQKWEFRELRLELHLHILGGALINLTIVTRNISNIGEVMYISQNLRCGFEFSSMHHLVWSQGVSVKFWINVRLHTTYNFFLKAFGFQETFQLELGDVPESIVQILMRYFAAF